MYIVTQMNTVSSSELRPREYNHLQRREVVVGEGQPPVDELLLFIVERVAVVYVELTLCCSLPDKRDKTSKMTTCHMAGNMPAVSRRVCTLQLPECSEPHKECKDLAPCRWRTCEPEAS